MNRYIIMAKKLADRFEKETLYLCDLDRKAGDGDHGITIARGFEEAYNHVSKLPEETSASEVCKEIGYGMLRSMGGASGPIFSTFFIQASIVLKGKEGWDVASFVETVHWMREIHQHWKRQLNLLMKEQKKGQIEQKKWLQQKEEQSSLVNVQKDSWMPEAVLFLLYLKLLQKFLEEINEGNIRLRQYNGGKEK